MDSQIHTYLHCRQCFASPPEYPIELGITATGLLITCPVHGRVMHFTPEKLAEWVAREPRCECCQDGTHRPQLAKAILSALEQHSGQRQFPGRLSKVRQRNRSPKRKD